jgi:hypothetical protein
MWTTIVASILLTLGCLLMILGSIPIRNTYNGKTLTVKFIIGKKVIDMTDARFLPVPEEVHHNILRVGGTSLGKIHSGNFVNTKTKTRYKFYLTGKGKQVYFEIGDQKYLVDDLDIKE